MQFHNGESCRQGHSVLRVVFFIAGTHNLHNEDVQSSPRTNHHTCPAHADGQLLSTEDRTVVKSFVVFNVTATPFVALLNSQNEKTTDKYILSQLYGQ